MKWEMALEKGKCLESQTEDWDLNSVERQWGTNDSSFFDQGSDFIRGGLLEN